MKQNKPISPPAQLVKSGPANPVELSSEVLRRAAEATHRPSVAPARNGTAHSMAWAEHRRKETQGDKPQTMGQRFQPTPMALHIAPLSRREQRPSVSYIRMRSATSFELVTHVLANGSLLEPRVRKFPTYDAAYSEQLLGLVAIREKHLSVLKQYMEQTGKDGESK